jgi:hypothetical protein
MRGRKHLQRASNTTTPSRYWIFGSSAIRDEGATALAEMLRHNSTIATLNLAHNRFGDEGAKSLAAEMLQHNSTITALSVNGGYISQDFIGFRESHLT